MPDSRIDVQATVLRFGSRTGWTGAPIPTLLLGQVTTPAGVLVADHLWLVVSRRLAALDLRPGDVFACRARVRQTDPTGQAVPGSDAYGLSYPTRGRVVARAMEVRP